MLDFDPGYAVVVTVDGQEVLRFDEDSCLLGAVMPLPRLPGAPPLEPASLNGGGLDIAPLGRPGHQAAMVYTGVYGGKTTTVGLSSLRFRIRGAVVEPGFGATFINLAASCDWSSLDPTAFSSYLNGASRRDRALVVAAWQGALVVQRPLLLSEWMWQSYAMPASKWGYEPFESCAKNADHCTDLVWTLDLMKSPPIFSRP